MLSIRILIWLLTFVLVPIFPLIAQVNFTMESGAVLTGSNKLRIPGNNGTFLSLSDELSHEISPFIRLSSTYIWKQKHSLRLLYAPLKVSYNGALNFDVFFQNTLFSQNEFVEVTFKFNSYRLSYNYLLVQNEVWQVGVGATLKVRDAYINLVSQSKSDAKYDLGFVPLLNFDVNYKVSPIFNIVLNADALAAPQGRAEDILLAIVLNPNKKYNIYCGYRFLEGGANNATVYTFSLFHYIVLGFSLSF